MPALFRYLLLILMFAGGLCASSSAADVLPTDEELSRFGLTRAWWLQATVNPDRDTIAHFTADETTVYVQSSSGVVTAIDSESGEKKWSRLVGIPSQASFPVVANDRFAFVASGMNLYALNKLTGGTVWQLRLEGHPSTQPEVDEDQIYIGMVDGSVYAYSLRELGLLYKERRLPDYSENALSWRYRTPTEVISPPISNGTNVAFASYDGSVYSVVTKDKQLNFQFNTTDDARIRIPVARAADTLFIASDDAEVVALDLNLGARRWIYTAGQTIRKQPRAVGGLVYVMPSFRGMICLKQTTGFEQWAQRRATNFVAASTDYVYASDDVGNMLMLDRKDGAIVNVFPYSHFKHRVQNERTDRIFLCTQRGTVVCLRETNRHYPIWHLFPERQPIRPMIAPDDAAAEEEVPVEETPAVDTDAAN